MRSELKLSSNVRFRVIEDEAVVVRQREGDVVVLNEVAARVLQLVGEGLPESAIGDRVVEEFDAPDEVVRGDVRRFLGELEELGVIERIETAEESG